MASTSRPRSISPRASRLAARLKRLAARYGSIKSIAPREPFELLLWEYVAYLTDDADRASAFARLRAEVGVTPAAILGARPAKLRAICRSGGSIGVAIRADRLRVAAERVRGEFGGTLRDVLRRPYPDARRILSSFPAIGPPGADKILLLTKARAVLWLDSNALRVLQRLGIAREAKSYSASHRNAQEAGAAQLNPSHAAMLQASLLLRRHGQDVCRRTRPLCFECPLRDACPSAESAQVISARGAGR